MTPKKRYMGNNPQSPEYNSNVPPGWNQWDQNEDWNGYEEDFGGDPKEEEINEDDETDEEPPHHDESV